jgi:hypothetical protein
MNTERTGLPISVAISGATTHDSLALEPLVRGIPPIRSRRGSRRVSLARARMRARAKCADRQN